MTDIVVNQKQCAIGPEHVGSNLLDFLRAQGLTGCKEGCAEGECGACAVLILRPDLADSSRSRWQAVNACLIPAASLGGQQVITAEGLTQADPASELHPVQDELARRGGSQCGYCTPGFVCAMAAEFYRPDRGSSHGGHGPNGFDLHALAGNLCRCTGYRPIRDAAYALGSPDPTDLLAMRLGAPAPDPVVGTFAGANGQLIRPDSLSDALSLLRRMPEAVPVAGSTDLGVAANLQHQRLPIRVAVDRLEELRTFEVGTSRIRLGAALTLTEIELLLAGLPEDPNVFSRYQKLGHPSRLLSGWFPQFASPLIRNSATLGGNLGTGSPIGDAPPVLLALDASLILISASGEREVRLADYFTGYRQSVRRRDELIKEIVIPLPMAPLTGFHKIAKRRFDDISSLAIGYALRLGRHGIVTDIKIGLGGVAATPIRAASVEAAIIGRRWTPDLVEQAAQLLTGVGTPMDDHRASAAYRQAMLGQSLRKFFQQTSVALSSPGGSMDGLREPATDGES